jgi:hypothetical protein
MNKAGSILGSLAVGAGLMYLLDPDRGSRRRALLRDQAVRGLHLSQDFLGKASRDLRHRAQGVVAEARHRVDSGRAPDDTLVARVRTKLGRCSTHPRAIEVTASDGVVTLRGPVLENEAEPLLEAIRSVYGVRRVEDQLERHVRGDHVPALQGGRRFESAARWNPTGWSPGLRLLGGVAAGAAVLYGTRLALARRGPSMADDDWDDESFHEAMAAAEEV